MYIEILKKRFFKLIRRQVSVPHPVNTVIGIWSVDGIFCLLADRRVYDDIGQSINVVYDPETNSCQSVVEAPPFPPKDLIRYHLIDGSTLTVCPSLGLRVSSRKSKCKMREVAPLKAI